MCYSCQHTSHHASKNDKEGVQVSLSVLKLNGFFCSGVFVCQAGTNNASRKYWKKFAKKKEERKNIHRESKHRVPTT